MTELAQGVKVQLKRDRYCDQSDLSKAYLVEIVRERSVDYPEAKILGLAPAELDWFNAYFD